MKWLIIGVIAIVGVIALIAVVGLLLPRDHVASRSVELNVPPDRVWATITNIDDFATWHPDVVKVERLPERNRHMVWREHTKSGGMSYELTETQPRSKFVTRIVDESAFGGTWTYDVQPTGAGTTVTITENGEVYNPVFRTLSRFVFGYTSTMDAYLAALRKKLQA